GSSVFDEREIMEWTWRCQRSFALDARRLDDRPPLLDFGLPQCGKRLRHLLFTRGNFDSEVNKSLMDAWIRQRTPDGTVQLMDYVLRRPFGRKNSNPIREREPGKSGLFCRRNIRHGNQDQNRSSRIATKTVIVAGQEGWAFQLAGPRRLDTVGRRGVDIIYSSIAIGDEVHAPSSPAFCRPTTSAHVGEQTIRSDFRFGSHVAPRRCKSVRSGEGLCRWRRSEAVLCPGRRGKAHAVPSRPPRQLDALQEPARGV